MIYLVRHCSTIENESHILCSDRNLGLSDKGIHQAAKLSEWFADKKIDVILASDLFRATQTANFISKVTRAEVKEYSELRERNVGGIYSNLVLNELKKIRSSNNHEYFDPTQDWSNVTPVESDEAVFRRTKLILQKHIKSNQQLVCVTHAGVIKAFLHSVFQMAPSRTNAFKVRNGCVMVFQNERLFDHLQLIGMFQLK